MRVVSTRLQHVNISSVSWRRIRGKVLLAGIAEHYKNDSDFYRIEKLIKSHIRCKRGEYLVKWLAYSNDFSSWVPEDNVKDISK